MSRSVWTLPLLSILKVLPLDLVANLFAFCLMFTLILKDGHLCRVLGNADTEHRIKVPILRGIVGLSARSCKKLGPDTKALSPEEANDLRKQVSASYSAP